MKKIKYIIGKNHRFWDAIHKINSAPLWKCVVLQSYPLNPKNKRSKLVVEVIDESLFKVIALASGLKFEKI